MNDYGKCNDCAEPAVRPHIPAHRRRCARCYQAWEGMLARRHVERVAEQRRQYKATPTETVERDLLKIERGSSDARDFVKAVQARLAKKAGGRPAGKPEE